MNNDEIMFYEVKDTEDFDKSVTRLVRKKKFRKLPEQLEALTNELQAGQFTGTELLVVDNPHYRVYKKRLPNIDTKSGQSNGYRIIYIVIFEQKTVGLLEIYYKKETDDLEDNYIKLLVDMFLASVLPAEE